MPGIGKQYIDVLIFLNFQTPEEIETDTELEYEDDLFETRSKCKCLKLVLH